MSWIEHPGAELFNGFNLTSLGIDEGILNITSSVIFPLWIYAVSTNCQKVSSSGIYDFCISICSLTKYLFTSNVQCPFKRLGKASLTTKTALNFTVDTKHPLVYRIRTNGAFNLVPWVDDNKYLIETYI